ncbi:uncharacterized protein LOC110901593 [Helianthus annuus]|uniref:uncharacterized protein LOC110901593 n=1 Tax=Helianthus annuus TaxID=4232 RepID=UPI000B905612|nr:uncharacterized protein LOC110901593 [Helianthus annuus]
MVDARYKDTQVDVRDIKEHLFKLIGSTPTPIFEKDDDDAKMGEKDSLRKLPPDSKAKPKPKVQQQPESAEQKSSKKASKAGKEKGIDEILNKKAEEIALENVIKVMTVYHSSTSRVYKKMSVFSTDQEFKSREEMMEWVQNTARDLIKNVDPDGNCGFRSVAVGLELDENFWGFIRSELVHEMDAHQKIWRQIFDMVVPGEYNRLRRNIDHQGMGYATGDHWMEMPHTGLLIANRFYVIVHLLSIGGNQTFFHLLLGPNQVRSPHQVVSLVHVYTNHFIHVKLEGDYPMPLPNNLWSMNRSDVAADWEVMYRSRINRYRELMNPNPDRSIQYVG